MDAWKGFCVPDKVLRALKEDGFLCPTSIQMMTLPAAIKHKKDILGAAETGSGKTLAFAIPLINHIMKEKKNFKPAVLPPPVDDSLPKKKKKKKKNRVEKKIKSGTVTVLPMALGIDSQFFAEDIPADEDGEMDLPPDQEDFEMKEPAGGSSGLVKVIHLDEEGFEEEEAEEQHAPPLYALVVAPTRELAAQVKAHIDKAARYTGIKTALIVGGLAEQKQIRMLKKRPEIVIGTPGRLWELINQGVPHLSKVDEVRYLVIDEADRMVERGHFEELGRLLEKLNSNTEAKSVRQTLVFSATLTLVHDMPHRLKKLHKKKVVAPSEKQKLEELMATIGFREKPKVIDLTQKCGTARTLLESRINCSHDEKDLYLYYFLIKHPGRTLVFSNSKDCVRRLSSILQLLQCCPLPLHADMHQHQRLKNLDRFKEKPRGLLLATDVAARGLDIPDIQHVIHYQVPRTSESYIHRSGRTARASKEGLTIMLVAPDEVSDYKKILKTTQKEDDLPVFPVEMNVLRALKERISLACAIDKEEHQQVKKTKENTWMKRAAQDMDIELDDDLLYDVGDQANRSVKMKTMKAWKHQLTSLLQQPVTGRWETGRYPTKEGKLISPFIQAAEYSTAIDELTKDMTKDRKNRKRKLDQGSVDKSGVGQVTQAEESTQAKHKPGQLVITDSTPSNKKKNKKKFRKNRTDKARIVAGQNVLNL